MASDPTEKSGGKKRRGRRRSYLINRAFQWKYTAVVVVAVFITATFMSYVLFGVLHQQARARVVNPAVVGVWENTLVIGLAGLAFSVALAFAFGMWTILITHRICGPMFVIEGYLNDLKQGRIPKPRTLRKKDEFKAFHEAFRDTIDALKVSKQSELEQLNKALEIARSGSEGDDRARKQTLELLRAQLASMSRDAAKSLGKEFTGLPARGRTDSDAGKEHEREFAEIVG